TTFFSFCMTWSSSRAANDTDDARRVPEIAKHSRELLAVLDLQPEQQRRRIALGVDADVIDVRMGRGNPARDLGKQPDTVERPDLDLGQKLALDLALPVHRDPFRRLLAVLGEIPARRAMNHDAAPARHEADDLVARDRIAAARIVHDQALGAGNLERLALARDLAVVAAMLREHPGDDRREPLAEPELL